MFNNFLKNNFIYRMQFQVIYIEAAITIISGFKLSIEVLLFQWSQVSRHLEWKPHIDA